jgi:N-methylhydantoinase B
VSINSAGAGGYGDPLERDLDAALNDILDGYVTSKKLQESYGVIFDQKDNTIDIAGTIALREKIRGRK